ncbi:type 1 glutamine amidotransferase [Sphingomonas morindae]|uniref:Type 1 glutamine amidotransferase n=1 Tax=Sphingomonas morindae TaxID=1541170 RepID=A0ABY4XCP8_9SPHN|nr:type 1 glutamine amidotransferase [Sphingomonas morindae]USI74754.1 type 1 glutamine amidotransferase [Sphingomonas morindae]
MPDKTLTLLIAETGPAQAREKRRQSVGRSAGETYEAQLAAIAPDARLIRVAPTDGDAALPPGLGLDAVDGVLLTGSPLHLYEDRPENRRVIDFMRAVFASGTPSFGSCAGLQIATVAAGGRVRAMAARREAGFARRIHPTAEGRDHPLLAGRPPAFDAPAIHGDEVEALPEGAVLLASNGVSTVQAAAIRCGAGLFWGVQYHPEISLFEVAAALRREAGTLIEQGLARGPAAVRAHAAWIEALHHAPDRADLAWRLGLDAEVTDPRRRSIEIRNFLEHLVQPVRQRRGRG